MKIARIIKLFFFFSLFLSVPFFNSTQAQTDAPPFRSGEIVLSGAPDTLPSGVQVKKYLPHANLTVIEVAKGKEWGMVQKYRNKGRRAGLNYIATAFGAVDDAFYNPYQWHLPKVQSEQAWDISTGQGIKVAVLDTGLATDGADDGVSCIDPIKFDIVNNDTNPDDGDGHGTHVAGTISQTTNNGKGTAGLAYGACIMPIKVLDDTGAGTFADIADGIYYAVNNNADIINMSLGIHARYNVRSDETMDPALNYAHQNGVTIICAAGNDAWRKNVSYPAIYPTTIAVGATDYNDDRARYSNYGYGLDIMAPGGNTDEDANGDGYGDGVLQETRINGDWGFYFFQGTSMAAPHVAAVAALLMANDNSLTPDQIRERLTTTALDLGDAGYDLENGYGLVQAYDALQSSASCTDSDQDGYCIEDGDCNDDNASVYPNATELCDDELDNDCDGSVDENCPVIIDVDGDGYSVEEGDCNDENHLINPGVIEVCGDLIDNDCDEQVDEDCSGPVCTEIGDSCSSHSDCCSNFCHPARKTCK